MASFEQRPPSDLHHQQQEVFDYVSEIVQELSDMSARAGLDQLSCDLRAAVVGVRDERDKSLKRRISGLAG